MQLVIIAGGKGTRLGLKDIPKPMVTIQGKPILEYQIDLAKQYGITEIFILSGHLSEVIVNYFKDGSQWGVKIHHTIEPYPLGTAGSVKLLEEQLKDRFMVFYGDVVMDFDLEAFINFDKQYNSMGTLLVHPNDHPFDSDLVQFSNDHIITAIHSKESHTTGYYQNMVNAAVYIFSPKIFNYIEAGISSDFGRDIFKKVISSQDRLVAYETPEYIKDMGTTKRLPMIVEDVISGKVARLNKKYPRSAIFLDRDGVINPNRDTTINLENFTLLPNVAQAIQKINKSEYLSIVVTNQPMIAKGFLSFEEYTQIQKKMDTLLGDEGAYLNKTYYCPHHPEKGFEGERPELKIDCACRKPKAGLLLQAQKELNIDFQSSWMIGDHERDIEAGKAVQCQTILIAPEKVNTKADVISTDLQSAINYIFSQGGL
ncbi:MAG: HAD-IIIA family hydrolase [Brevinema sp.]